MRFILVTIITAPEPSLANSSTPLEPAADWDVFNANGWFAGFAS